MGYSDNPITEETRSRRILAALCLISAAACIVGLLVIGFRGDPTAAWKQGQATWRPEIDRGAR